LERRGPGRDQGRRVRRDCFRRGLPAWIADTTGTQRRRCFHHASSRDQHFADRHRRRGVLRHFLYPDKMNGSPDIILVRDLKIGYGERVILQNVNFLVRRGEVLVILGGSGCGKSTLLKNLIGLYTPLAGEVWIEEGNLAAARGDERLRLLRKFGVTYQSGALFGSMSVLENVRLPLDELSALPEPLKEIAALAMLKLVGLAAAARKFPSELSGGMQKRVAIARAMVLGPRILFLDEPSAGLDPVTSADLDLLIKELARRFGITFVIVTHEL